MLYLGLRPTLYLVRGPSMEPSLFDGDVLLVTSPRRSPRRGDVAIVGAPTGMDVGWQVKRVVGLPGDHVSFECGLLYVNGAHHPEPYLGGLPADVGLASRSWQVGSDECVVLGDNRARSTDSRDFGPIPMTRLAGLAVVRLWPFYRKGRRARVR